MEHAFAFKGTEGSSPLMWPDDVMTRSPGTAYGPQRFMSELITVTGGGGGAARLRLSRAMKNPAARTRIRIQVPRFRFKAAMGNPPSALCSRI